MKFRLRVKRDGDRLIWRTEHGRFWSSSWTLSSARAVEYAAEYVHVLSYSL